MKPLDEQNHYEALEVPSDASAAQIERAYRLARASFSDDSMALYSVFDSSDASTIRERLDLAYRVLSDVDERRRYDEGVLGREPGEPEAPVLPAATAESAAAVHDVYEDLEDLEEDEEGLEFDGPRLRRARLRRGIEIDQVASITKINPSYLRFIEEEGYDDLPARVYVRDFLCAYARAIGLEADKVAASYLARMDGAGTQKRGSRLLGAR